MRIMKIGISGIATAASSALVRSSHAIAAKHKGVRIAASTSWGT